VEREPGNTLSVIGIIFGVLGFCFAGIPLGAVAILCGIAGLMREEKYGGIALAIGVIDILAAIVALGVLGL